VFNGGMSVCLQLSALGQSAGCTIPRLACLIACRSFRSKAPRLITMVQSRPLPFGGERRRVQAHRPPIQRVDEPRGRPAARGPSFQIFKTAFRLTSRRPNRSYVFNWPNLTAMCMADRVRPTSFAASDCRIRSLILLVYTVDFGRQEICRFFLDSLDRGLSTVYSISVMSKATETNQTGGSTMAIETETNVGPTDPCPICGQQINGGGRSASGQHVCDDCLADEDAAYDDYDD
jgi:hypothetical protein